MPERKISELDAADPLVGDEAVPLVQAATTTRATAQAIADLTSSGHTYVRPGTSLVDAPALLLLPGAHAVDTDLTLTGSVGLTPGATIRPASGVTVTLAGTLVAPVDMIFDLGAGGTVVLAPTAAIPLVHPEWWGAVGDGVTSDRAACIAMLAALQVGRTVVFSPGRAYATYGMSVTGLDGLTIEAEGATIRAASAGALFKFTRCTRLTVRGLTLDPVGAGVGGWLFDLDACRDVTVDRCHNLDGGLARVREDDNGTPSANIDIVGCSVDGNGRGINLLGFLGVRGASVRRCRITNTAADGIKLSRTSAEIHAESVSITECEISHCGDDAIDMYSGGRWLRIEGNHIHHSATAANLKWDHGPWEAAPTEGAWFVANRVEDCTTGVRSVRGQRIKVLDNMFYRVGPGSAGGVCNHFNAPFLACEVRGNHFIGCSGATLAVNVGGSPPPMTITIAGNVFEDSATSDISLSDGGTANSGHVFLVQGNHSTRATNRFLVWNIGQGTILLLDNTVTDGTHGARRQSSASGPVRFIAERNHFDVSGVAFLDAAGTPAIVHRRDNSFDPDSTGWTPFGNLAVRKTLDADSTSVDELADVLGTLIERLKLSGVIRG